MLLSSCLWLIFLCKFYLVQSARNRVFNRQQKVSKFDRKTGNYRAWREQYIIRDLLKNYQATVRPKGREENSTGPVTVLTSIHLRSISTVSDADMDFVAQFRFQQEWYDERLAFSDAHFRSFEYIHVAKDQVIWRPDTFFQNEKDGWYHNLDQPNVFIKLNSKGKVIYNRRLTLTLACNMDLLRYPMDTQSCRIDFASYAYTTTDIVYVWDYQPLHIHQDAAQILPNFFIKEFTNSSCTSVTNTGEYSCLRVVVKLERVFSFFLLQLYIPSSMLVAVSWVSYWIDWKSTAARVPLAIVTLLTMITQSASTNANLPPVSYTKALDVWIGACVVFIFASLIEYAVVNYIGISDERAKQVKLQQRLGRFSEFNLELEEQLQEKSSLFSKLRLGKKRRNRAPKKEVDFFGSPALSSTESPEKVALLRRRGRLGRREFYTEEFQLKEMSSSSRTSPPITDSPSHVMSMEAEPDWVIEEPDMIRLSNKKRFELFRFCTILQSKTRAERIDMIARIIFPSAFVMFNIAYWTVYWNKS